MSSLSADGGAKTKKKKKKIRKDDAAPTIAVTEVPPTADIAPVTPKRRVKVKKSSDDPKSPRSSKASATTTSNTNATHVNNKASHSDEAAHAVVSSTRRHGHASGSTASDDSGGGGDASSLNVPSVDSSKKKSRKSIATAIDGSSSAGSFSVKKHVKKVFGFGSFLSGTRSSKADDEQRADPSIDMGVVNEMLDALGDNGTAAARGGGGGSHNVTTAASRSSPFRDNSGPFSSASSQVDDTDDDMPGSLQRRSSSARYQLLRQRSQVVNQQYEGAKRQLQRLVSDSSMRSSDPDEFTAESPPLSPTSDVSGSPTKGITFPQQQQQQQQQQRGVVKRSSSVSIESPARIRRQARQAILAPTRVAPTPVVVPSIVTRRSASGDDIPPPQYTLAPPSSGDTSTSGRPARDATTAAFLACMYEVSQMREKINVTASTAEAHAREVSQELAQEQTNNAAQLREVDSKLDKSETSLRTVRDSIQKLENRIQVVKRAQRNANVALKAGQLLPVLGLMALFVYGVRLLIFGGS